VEIKYVKHPLALEEKRKLNEQGFKVIDIAFKREEAAKKPTPKKK